MKKISEAIDNAILWEKEHDNDFESKIPKKNFGSIDIQKKLSIYKVVRNFKGNSHHRFDHIVLYLKKNGYKKTPINPIEEVNNLIKLIIQEYGFVSTSASSKLLWPFYKDKIVIYDKNAVEGLKHMGAKGIKDNYEFFYWFWMKKFEEFEPEIIKECKKKKIDNWKKKEFRMRVFDKYLWLGGG